MRSKGQIFAHQVKWSGIYFRRGRQIGFPNIPDGSLLELHLVVDSPRPNRSFISDLGLDGGSIDHGLPHLTSPTLWGLRIASEQAWNGSQAGEMPMSVFFSIGHRIRKGEKFFLRGRFSDPPEVGDEIRTKKLQIPEDWGWSAQDFKGGKSETRGGKVEGSACFRVGYMSEPLGSELRIRIENPHPHWSKRINVILTIN